MSTVARVLMPGTNLAETTVNLPCPECGHDGLTLEVEIDAAAITLYCAELDCIGELEDETAQIITPMIIQALSTLAGDPADQIADAIIASLPNSRL